MLKKKSKVVKKKVTKKATPKTNLERSKKLLEGLGSGANEFWKPKEGTAKIRIMPARSADEDFFYKMVLHYGFSVNGDRRAFPCFGALDKPRCPVCKVIALHEDDESPDIQKAVKGLMPKSQWLMNVWPVKTDKVFMWGAGVTVMKKVKALINNEDYGDITDAKEGFNLTITREGSGLNTEYDVTPSPRPSAITLEGWEDMLYDLKEKAYREIPTTSKYIEYLMDNYGDLLDIRSIFREERMKLKKKKVKDEEEEDEEVEEDEEEDAEEEEEEEETEEDEDGDDDELDEDEDD